MNGLTNYYVWRSMVYLGGFLFFFNTGYSIIDLMGLTSSKSRILPGLLVETTMNEPEWLWLDPEQKNPNPKKRRVIAPFYYWLALPIFWLLMTIYSLVWYWLERKEFDEQIAKILGGISVIGLIAALLIMGIWYYTLEQRIWSGIYGVP